MITLRANRVCLFVWSLQVFYQVCSGATAAERQAYCLENANYYYYLSVSGCYQVPGINDVEDWREMTESMQTVGINESERQEVIRSIAVCLWLGNIAFVEKRPEVAEVQDRAVLDIVAGGAAGGARGRAVQPTDSDGGGRARREVHQAEHGRRLRFLARHPR